MYELKILMNFAAAHQLKLVAKKCENLHGHNWKIEIFVEGEYLNSHGVLIDFGELKAKASEIISDLDHKFLNELECFKDNNPSSENIAKYIAVALKNSISNLNIRIKKVTAWESEDACATFII